MKNYRSRYSKKSRKSISSSLYDLPLHGLSYSEISRRTPPVDFDTVTVAYPTLSEAFSQVDCDKAGAAEEANPGRYLDVHPAARIR